MPDLGPDNNYQHYGNQNEPEKKSRRPGQGQGKRNKPAAAVDTCGGRSDPTSANKNQNRMATGGLDGGERYMFNQQQPRPQTSKRSGQPARHPISNNLRREVLQRYHYCCCQCGVSSQADKTVRLEVDHITPISRGGTNDQGNLQILCRACNQVKTNHII